VSSIMMMYCFEFLLCWCLV